MHNSPKEQKMQCRAHATDVAGTQIQQSNHENGNIFRMFQPGTYHITNWFRSTGPCHDMHDIKSEKHNTNLQYKSATSLEPSANPLAGDKL